MRHVVALFGESEKGQFKKPHVLHELPQLMDALGNPPSESEGVFFAIQALLYKREVIFFRVHEEGFSQHDYLEGFTLLKELHPFDALCLPGVGDANILEASRSICDAYKSPLITSQKDLYDYLTSGY